MKYCFVNDKRLYAFRSPADIVNFGNDGIYVSLAAESIYSTNVDFIRIINDNFGYADGEAAALALKVAGFDPIKIPGVELWLKFVENMDRKVW